MAPNLDRLRRFSLMISAVYIVYAVVGIELEPGAKFSVQGATFIVHNPQSLPWLLLFASLYALWRFFYCRYMLASRRQVQGRDRSGDEDRKPVDSGGPATLLPFSSRIANFIHDFDYTFPLWVSVLALAVAAIKTWV